MSVREPHFADDRWYPSSPDALTQAMDGYVGSKHREPVVAVVSPHAGYFYSGHVAGAVYGQISVPERVVILGVNHRGIGNSQAIMTQGHWRIPGRDVPIDTEAALRIKARVPGMTEDTEAHRLEHSLELQLPFLVHQNPKVRIVPLLLGRVTLEQCQTLGAALADILPTLSGETLLVASTDLNHHENAAVGNAKDSHVMAAIERLDPEGLLHVVSAHGISMCGVMPTLTTLYAARGLGAKHGALVRYADSGDVSGDKSSVVGYAGMVL